MTRWIVSLFLMLIISLAIVPDAHAIIFIPALVLIPVAKIVAVIIGGFLFPALGVGALWSKLFGESLKKTIGVVLMLLILVTVILVVLFMLFDSGRPLL